MPSVVKMLLKGEDRGSALNSLGTYIVVHGKSWKNHGIVILNFCGNPENGHLKIDKTKILMTEGRKNCRMLPLEHSAILLTCIKQ